jgi:hypothetical protein
VNDNKRKASKKDSKNTHQKMTTKGCQRRVWNMKKLIIIMTRTARIETKKDFKWDTAFMNFSVKPESTMKLKDRVWLVEIYL